MNSFERFFSSVEKIDDNFEKKRTRTENAQLRSAPPGGADQDLERIEIK